MKKLVFILLALIVSSSSIFAQGDLLTGGGNQGKKELTTDKKASISWDKNSYDFGEIKQNKPQKIEFKFTNTGDKPVIISKAEASCGCTELQYSKEPILPGKTRIVSTIYDAKALGVFQKSITIFTNLEAPHHTFELNVKGVVVQ